MAEKKTRVEKGRGRMCVTFIHGIRIRQGERVGNNSLGSFQFKLKRGCSKGSTLTSSLCQVETPPLRSNTLSSSQSLSWRPRRRPTTLLRPSSLPVLGPPWTQGVPSTTTPSDVQTGRVRSHPGGMNPWVLGHITANEFS